MSLLHFQTRAQRMRFELTAAANSADDARGRKVCLQYALPCAMQQLEYMLDCGVAKPAIAEALAILIDATSDADTECNREIDAAGQEFDEIDLTEARELLERIRT